MPDWLRQDLLGDSDVSPDIESIFQPEEDSQIIEATPAMSAAPAAKPYEIEVDTSDPWVEAFDEEYAQGGMADIDAVPAWYEQNLSDPARIAAVEGQTAEAEAANELEAAALPEENALSAGQPEAVPSWVAGFEPVEEQETASANVFEEMPDWLREVEASVAPEDVPDWLVETIGEPEKLIRSIFRADAAGYRRAAETCACRTASAQTDPGSGSSSETCADARARSSGSRGGNRRSGCCHRARSRQGTEW